MSENDLGSTVKKFASYQIDNFKKDKESSRKQNLKWSLLGGKKKVKKCAARNKDESAKNKGEALMERADNIVSELS